MAWLGEAAPTEEEYHTLCMINFPFPLLSSIKQYSAGHSEMALPLPYLMFYGYLLKTRCSRTDRLASLAGWPLRVWRERE